jgi:hypothetical protein
MLLAHPRRNHTMGVTRAWECSAVEKNTNGREKPAPESVKIHSMVSVCLRSWYVCTDYLLHTSPSKISGTTPKNLNELSEATFGVSDWLSPFQLYRIFAAAGCVNHFKEYLGRDILVKAGLTKFKGFQGEVYEVGVSDVVLGPQEKLPEVRDDSDSE